jgi:hypothetical protein
MQKMVTFNEDNNKVLKMVVWAYAYKQARKSDFQRHYLDRLRYEKRIKQCEMIICKILDVNHRTVIYNERFK